MSYWIVDYHKTDKKLLYNILYVLEEHANDVWPVYHLVLATYPFLILLLYKMGNQVGKLQFGLLSHPPPIVSQSSVRTDLLEPLKVLSEFVVELVGQHLGELSVLEVLLPVQKPVGDLVLARVLHDGYYPVDLGGGEGVYTV